MPDKEATRPLSDEERAAGCIGWDDPIECDDPMPEGWSEEDL